MDVLKEAPSTTPIKDYLLGVNLQEEMKYLENMNQEIQQSRIIYVLNRAVEKLKVMVNFPCMMQNDWEFLKKYLNEEQLIFVQDVFFCYREKKRTVTTATDYTNILTQLRLKNPNAKEHFKYLHTYEKKFEPHVSQMIDIIYDNKELVSAAKDLNDGCSNRILLAFLKDFEQMYKYAMTRIRITKAQKVERDNNLVRAYRANAEMKIHLRDLQKQLETQRAELGGQLKEKNEILNSYSKKKEELQKDFDYAIKDTLQDSEVNMMSFALQSEEKQNSLAAEAKQIVQEYESLLKDNLSEEKVLRVKRSKIEAQLASWLMKYDADMGYRQTEYDTLKQQFDEEHEEMINFQKLFDDQEEEYKVLWQEKLDEDQAIWEENLYAFICNRAARKIQRCWRDHRARRLARRKKRRKDKKGAKGQKKAPKEKREDEGEVIKLGKGKVLKKHGPIKRKDVKFGMKDNAADVIKQQFGEETVSDVKDVKFEDNVKVEL